CKFGHWRVGQGSGIYIYLKPKLQNGKYLENEFKLLGLPKGKHIMGTLEEEDILPVEEEELHEDIGVLEHWGRRHPTDEKEIAHE
ncbi:hypothetical protein KI387_000047, partial [Taxus chinensis]